MKIVRTILPICFCVILLSISNLTVLAAENESFPRAEVCGNCKKGVLFSRTYTEDEGYWERCPYTDVEGATDLVRYHVTYSALICNHCGAKAQIKQLSKEFFMRQCSHI